MKYDPKIHHRRSIRLKGYDYTREGAYFITVCAYKRECLFGRIVDHVMGMNDVGHIVGDEWVKTVLIREEIELGDWVVMPNHFHGIIFIVGSRGTARRAPTGERLREPVRGSIPTIVRAFKSAVTKRVNELRGIPGAKLWQRNYWEHIIRDESDLNRIREYIQTNPARWEKDTLFTL
jgi:REP element-mobilizing transposase RayT